MVAVNVGTLDMGRDVLAGEPQRTQEGAPKLRRGARGRAAHVAKAPHPADSAERNIHRAGPIHAPRPGVSGDPIGDFGGELTRVALASGQPVGLPKRGEMLTSAELPRDLDVRGAIELAVVDSRRVLQRPFAAALEVGVPWQRRSKVHAT